METYVIGIIAGGGFLLVVIIIILIVCICRRNSKSKKKVVLQSGGETTSVTSVQNKTIKTLQKKHGVVSNRTISGILKLPPKGEEEEAPLPLGYEVACDPGATAPLMKLPDDGALKQQNKTKKGKK